MGKNITTSVKCFKTASWALHRIFPCSHNIKVNEYLFSNYLLKALFSHLFSKRKYFTLTLPLTKLLPCISSASMPSSQTTVSFWNNDNKNTHHRWISHTGFMDWHSWFWLVFSISFLLTPNNLFVFLTTRSNRSLSVRLPNYRPFLTGNTAVLTWKVDGGLVKNSRRSVLTKGI